MNLNFDFDAVAKVADQIGTLHAEFETLLNDIITINSDLKTAWAGDDASKYSMAIEEQTEDMRRLSQTIAEIQEFLVQVNKAYADVSQANMEAIQ